MATLTPTAITPTGVVEAALVAAAGGGDQFSNDGRTYFKVTNGGGAPITVTVVSQRACDQGTIHSIANSVTNATTEVMGPFDPARFNDASGFVQVTYSAVTTVTVGVFRLS
jgi:hypothetical protein